jgi:hypothetical protein
LLDFARALLEFARRFKSGYIFLNISIWLGAFKNIFLAVDINLPTFINFDRDAKFGTSPLDDRGSSKF